MLFALFLTGILAATGLTQQITSKAPTAADWAALAKLSGFTGVWERAGVGSGGNPVFGTPPARGNRGPTPQGGAAPAARGAAAGPSFTPQYEAMRAAAARGPQPEDNSTANCLPPGMPGIMGQPYPMEFLLTPGKVT